MPNLTHEARTARERPCPKVHFMVKKVLSCEQERKFAAFCDPSPSAIPPEGASWEQEGAALRVKTGKRE